MSTDELPTIIGLTGGIGSGKSTVSNIFRELGVRVIDADVIAREVVAPGTPGLEEIRAEFGEAMIDDEGRLDRAQLGTVVFANPEARRRLEEITHPKIAARMLEKAAEAAEDGDSWVIYDAALLVENGLHDAFGGLIVVALPRELQIERVMARDESSRDAVEERIDAQMPLERKVAVADWVIDNSRDLEATRRQVVETKRAIEASL